jgi:hypothetical protein
VEGGKAEYSEVNGARSNAVGGEHPDAGAVEHGGVATLSTGAKAVVEKLACKVETVLYDAATDTG